jgi:nitroreductase
MDPLHDSGSKCTLDCLDMRRSTPSRLLAEPGPDHDTLLRMLRSAVRVPDHGKLVPWRLLLIRGPARAALGERVAARLLERNPEAATAAVDKERQRFSNAPLVVAVVACIADTARIPEQEQLLSAGCVCFALLQAAQATGYGAQWLTGLAAYDRPIATTLGLAEHERVIGFIHIGTPTASAPERVRPDPAALLSEWHG